MRLKFPLIMILAAVFFSLQASAFSQQKVQWLRSATQAAEAAKKTGKPILVYVRSATCHWCDRMQTDVWQNPQAASVINQQFVPLKLTREQNPEAVQALQVKGFPATIVFSAEKKYLHKIDGYVDSKEFLDQMGKIRVASSRNSMFAK